MLAKMKNTGYSSNAEGNGFFSFTTLSL